MASIVIVSGCPGSGKTTLSGALARGSPRGVHVRSDVFYGFPAHPVDPTLPASHQQNTTIVRALARTAGAFAEDGHDVVLDGIFGPWFLPVLCPELPGSLPVSYLVLRASEREALRRVRGREGRGASARVRHMVAAFADLGTWRAHALDTEGRSAAEVEALARAGLARDRFRLEGPAGREGPSG